MLPWYDGIMGSQTGAPVEVGEVVAGKYRVDRLLGTGGMGVVLAATQVDLDRRVAIKFLLPAALKSPEVVARFSREARAAARIQSEHVARVIDVGVLPTGAPYMVMEYLDGTDLAQRISAGERLPLGEAARYLLEACEALAEAHAAGIVHRDLKPANLFLARRPDRTCSVKVLDFGISKSPIGDGGITSTQAVMGSPLYMSPEQLVSAKRVDHRTDIWSLGIVLFEALSGAPPFVADTMPEIVAQILTVPAPSVCGARPDLPAQIDAIVARCLAKDASARFKDVAELARALGPFVRDGARFVERVSRVLGQDGGGQTAETYAASPGSAGLSARLAFLTTPGSATRSESSWAGTQPAGIPNGRSVRLRWIATGGALVLAGAVTAGALHGSRAARGTAAASATQPGAATAMASVASPGVAREPNAPHESRAGLPESLARLADTVDTIASAAGAAATAASAASSSTRPAPAGAAATPARRKAPPVAAEALAPRSSPTEPASAAPSVPAASPQTPLPPASPAPTNALNMPFK